MPLVAPTSVTFSKSESLDTACPQEPGTFCHQDPVLVLCALFGLKLAFLLQDSRLTVPGSASRLQGKYTPQAPQPLAGAVSLERPGTCLLMLGTQPSMPTCSSSDAGRPGPSSSFPMEQTSVLLSTQAQVLGRSFSLSCPYTGNSPASIS